MNNVFVEVKKILDAGGFDYEYNKKPQKLTAERLFDGANYAIGLVTKYDFTIEHIAQHGGEDEGSDYWNIYKFTDKTTREGALIKFQGRYASHVGTDYWGLYFEVKPVEVTRTEYQGV